MKRKLLLLVAVVLVAVMAFAGCTDNEKAYSRTTTSMDGLKVAMGDDMLYPDVELKSGEFFDSYAHRNEVTLAAGARNNEIILLYIPAISKADAEKIMADASTNGEVRDTKAYRYSIKQTVDSSYGDGFAKGVVEIYIHGTNYAVEGLNGTKVKQVPVQGEGSRQEKLNSDNKKDSEKLGDKYISRVVKVNDIDVLEYENRLDGEFKRYFNIGDNYSYELTACIRVDGNVGKDIKDKTEKAAAIDAAYDELLAAAKTMVDGYVDDMIG